MNDSKIIKRFNSPCYSPGGCCELMVATDLMKMGYEVYRNIVNHRYFDMLAYLEPNTFIKIEVTTGHIYKSNGKRRYLKHEDTNMYWDVIGVVYPDTIIYYDNKYQIVNLISLQRG